ncbi:ubiquinone biosynthesis protein COQ7 [Perkinsela sp. CCAP 1560/4]|nr:ubiquinone biosynthesis protein COQ7 [Perkinsela sp. CCAP 1560/4]|eukprot:KNH06827.1 ubiquinone biosynthesis protein COQ7 [Perkinsela sp. CCAP 1560/4]
MANRQLSRVLGQRLSLPLRVGGLSAFTASHRSVSAKVKTKPKSRLSKMNTKKTVQSGVKASPSRMCSDFIEPPEIDISQKSEFSLPSQNTTESASKNTDSFIQRFPHFPGYEHAINAKLQEMIAVDLAGETAAVRICQTHLFFYPEDHVVQEILQEEETHYDIMTQWATQLRVPHSLLDPIFHLASVAMGGFTALLGPKAVMCCHAAIEEVITAHYNDQLREVVAIERAISPEADTQDAHTAGLQPHTDTTKDQLVSFRKTVKQLRDEEQHHHELGIDHGGMDFMGASILYNAVKCACRVGIFLAKRL